MQGHRHGVCGQCQENDRKDAEEGAVGQAERRTQELWDWGKQRPERRHEAGGAGEIKGTNGHKRFPRRC